MLVLSIIRSREERPDIGCDVDKQGKRATSFVVEAPLFEGVT